MSDFISYELTAYISEDELTAIVSCESCKKQFRTDEENKNICDTCLKKSKQ